MTPEDIQYISDNKDFVEKHLHDDPVKLLLKHSNDEGKKLLIAQIAARQKIRKKIPSWYDNRDLIFFPGLSLEQASSEDTAQLKSTLIKGQHLLDITGGLGVDTYFLSKSFGKTTYVERNQDLYNQSAYNLKVLSNTIETICADGAITLKDHDADVVYIDPYRRDNENRKMVSFSDCEPNVLEMMNSIISNNRRGIIKASPMLDISRGIEELKHVYEVWVISSRNDCKELVFNVKKSSTGNINIKTFNITPSIVEKFDFEWSEGEKPSILFSEPLQYLYEPNASILKSGGQDYLAQAYNLHKLHPNSNIFTSLELVPDFPGKQFRLDEILSPFHKSLKKGQFNVISRNFPNKANEIEKKLKLSPSKNNYLLATKTINDKHIFIKAILL